MPTTGPDKISRRIQHADTLKGSKKLHWYVDIGEEGKLLVHNRPCHLHERCMNLDKEYILTSCPSNDVCGEARIEVVKLFLRRQAPRSPAD